MENSNFSNLATDLTEYAPARGSALLTQILDPHLRFHLTVAGKACAVNAFALEAVEPAFGRGIVPAVAFATHRAGHAVGVESVLKGLAGILDATVGVMNNPWCGAAAKPGHGQGVSGQL